MRTTVAAAMRVCPVEVAMAVVGGSWKLTIVKHLLAGTLRRGELGRAIPQAPDRSLTRQLRELEEDGILARRVIDRVPPMVEYSLTDVGRTLAPLVEVVDGWGAEYGRAVGM